MSRALLVDTEALPRVEEAARASQCRQLLQSQSILSGPRVVMPPPWGTVEPSLVPVELWKDVIQCATGVGVEVLPPDPQHEDGPGWDDVLIPPGWEAPGADLRSGPQYGDDAGSHDVGHQASSQYAPPECTLFIFHLPYAWNESSLENNFGVFGNIVSKHVARTPEGASRGFGFVGYDNRMSAQHAVEAMNQLKVEGKVLLVKLKDDVKNRGKGNRGSSRSQPYPLAANTVAPQMAVTPHCPAVGMVSYSTAAGGQASFASIAAPMGRASTGALAALA